MVVTLGASALSEPFGPLAYSDAHSRYLVDAQLKYCVPAVCLALFWCGDYH